MGDFTYRSREEVEQWKSRCPILRLRQRLLEEGSPNLAALDGIDSEVAAIVEAAHQFAEQSAWPDPATATRHVFSEKVERR
jgi:2-oxoisovalerate dehydrogenase E1 component